MEIQAECILLASINKSKSVGKTTYEALIESIKILKNDIQLGDIGSIIQKYLKKRFFSCKDFSGHVSERNFMNIQIYYITVKKRLVIK